MFPLKFALLGGYFVVLDVDPLKQVSGASILGSFAFNGFIDQSISDLLMGTLQLLGNNFLLLE